MWNVHVDSLPSLPSKTNCTGPCVAGYTFLHSSIWDFHACSVDVSGRRRKGWLVCTLMILWWVCSRMPSGHRLVWGHVLYLIHEVPWDVMLPLYASSLDQCPPFFFYCLSSQFVAILSWYPLLFKSDYSYFMGISFIGPRWKIWLFLSFCYSWHDYSWCRLVSCVIKN